MTVGRLLREADSRELTMWLAFLDAKHERDAEALKHAREDAAIMGAE